MNTESSRQHPDPFTVVIGYSFTEASGRAFDQAAQMAGRVAGSHLHVLHVLTDDIEPRPLEPAGQLRLCVEEKMAALGGCAWQSVGIHLRTGRPDRELAQFAAGVGADLIFVGSGEATLRELFVGSVAERLLRHTPCSVVVAGPAPPAPEANEPAIEPTCPDCVSVRQGTAGHFWWCARHEHHLTKAHVYSYQRQHPLRTHDSAVTPTGVGLTH